MNEEVKTSDNGPLALQATLWRILIDPVEVKTHTTTPLGVKIALTQETIDAQSYLQYIGEVVSIGPLCFTKAAHFADLDGNLNRPCEVGDMVIYGRHTGVEVYQTNKDGQIQRLRVINDDQILAKVDDLDRMQIPL